MESNWRFGIAEVGMAFADWELAARYLDVPDGVWMVVVKLRDFPPGVVRYYRITLDLSDGLNAEFYLESSGHVGNFPHGLNVEPD